MRVSFQAYEVIHQVIDFFRTQSIQQLFIHEGFAFVFGFADARSAGCHQGDDQGCFDAGDGQGKYQGAKWFAYFVCDDFGVVAPL